MTSVTAKEAPPLKAAGVIRSDARWREDLLKGGPVRYECLLDLCARIERQAEPAALTADASLSWAALTRRRMATSNR
ncbi:hypothetical protein [Burkholderia multivorans]|uniref:hypothetical protein n=1 Tax=Burkholderia multivorans TaxID=87883 RepID=UPI00209D5780|nr:hypothetical protein [Burkholderia multivorans]MCO8350775.1 hypothetical protein [Burkholderia multivorans]MCO8387890.1 hypothetical protein [Burkholderia multivorans]MCO8407581.1 hypothetical protein [Burkholderia multivorans]MCO8431252.1 hypothetical protein [Burkholderia multivorans]MCO8451297.1 hypothetical protein [Burkholderia multivorans]